MNTIFEILFYEVQYRHRYPSYRLHVHSQSFILGRAYGYPDSSVGLAELSCLLLSSCKNAKLGKFLKEYHAESKKVAIFWDSIPKKSRKIWIYHKIVVPLHRDW